LDVQVISSLEAGCPVDIRDTAGNTLFIIAAQNGNKNMCKVISRPKRT
jgi:ankyrin repeat protein